MYKTRLKIWKASRYEKKPRKPPRPSTSPPASQVKISASVCDAQCTMTKSDYHDHSGEVPNCSFTFELLHSNQAEGCAQGVMPNAPTLGAEWMVRGGGSSSSSEDIGVTTLNTTLKAALA